ncbi:hypothetical protein MMYC01_205101 [Madurella mycetomatis]|uniref:Uncharacterized protein n=1 Tax=Madurella mycetomatis TaxID=100816 RepID=A0A175W4H6_9PEZI|nr:hypothetical protein MMYC01_205101 [Madurella mycetomatis]
MEDEEFYHFMLDDLERLEQAHRHSQFPSARQLGAKDINGEHTHSPMLSGFVSALSNVVKTTMDTIAARISERRKSTTVGH